MKIRLRLKLTKPRPPLSDDASTEIETTINIGQIVFDRDKFDLGNVAGGVINNISQDRPDLNSYDKWTAEFEVLR